MNFVSENKKETKGTKKYSAALYYHTSTQKLHVMLFFRNLTTLDKNNLDRISNRMI